jgi:hypothetical protein
MKGSNNIQERTAVSKMAKRRLSEVSCSTHLLFSSPMVLIGPAGIIGDVIFMLVRLAEGDAN